MPAELTPREVAELSGAPKSAVEKAIEEKIFTPWMRRVGPRRRRFLPAHAVGYAKIIDAMKYRMDAAMKRRLVAAMGRIEVRDFETWRFELEPAVELNVGRLVGDSVERASAYAAARDRLIVSDEEILGGTPVIRGTRLSVYAILGRLKGDDSVEDIVADYPGLTREAVEVAAIYARSHPLVGRPGGRPWSAAA